MRGGGLRLAEEMRVGLVEHLVDALCGFLNGGDDVLLPAGETVLVPEDHKYPLIIVPGYSSASMYAFRC